MKVRSKSAGERVIDAPGHPPVVAGPGEVIEVADDLGKSLLEQVDRWEPVTGSSKKSAGKSGEEE